MDAQIAKLLFDYGLLGVIVWFLGQIARDLVIKAEKYILQEQQELEAEMKILSGKLDKIILLLSRMAGINGID
jgi:hypothetical protein